MKIKEDLPRTCKNCKKFVLKVNEQVIFIGKTGQKSLNVRCKFADVCSDYKRETQMEGES